MSMFRIKIVGCLTFLLMSAFIYAQSESNSLSKDKDTISSAEKKLGTYFLTENFRVLSYERYLFCLNEQMNNEGIESRKSANVKILNQDDWEVYNNFSCDFVSYKPISILVNSNKLKFKTKNIDSFKEDIAPITYRCPTFKESLKDLNLAEMFVSIFFPKYYHDRNQSALLF